MQEKLGQCARQMIFFISHESFVLPGSPIHHHDCPVQTPSSGRSLPPKMHPNILMKPPMAQPDFGKAGQGLTRHVAPWKSFGTAMGTPQPQQGQLCNKSWWPPWPVPTQGPRSGSPDEMLPAQIPDMAVNCALPAQKHPGERPGPTGWEIQFKLCLKPTV